MASFDIQVYIARPSLVLTWTILFPDVILKNTKLKSLTSITVIYYLLYLSVLQVNESDK